jgi:hypothetical protein
MSAADRYRALEALGMAHAKMPEKTPDMSSGVYNDYLYAAMLTELESNGFAVVKMPEPDPQGCYSAGGGTRVMVTSDGHITNGYAIRENADEARALAGALLAAVAQLEAQS